ncbi:MAG: molecular chaperone HtpG [Ardenticatenaceae bacterium]|nr:molecular chaperone HtpG [Ardenticatenaceae bacterium]
MNEQVQDSFNFKTEVKQLLHILVHSLYKDRDIFLRELVSNASDAMTRMHFEMLTNRDVLDPDAELAIHVEVPEVAEGEPKQIIIKDSGIGMTKDELVTNLGTIAQSGAREFLAKMGEDETLDPGDVIGQFGVGFYSVFMIADEVRVVSRSYKKRAKAAVWISDGSESFRVEPAEKEDRGTEIHIILKKDAEEFANEWKLKQIVKKHSDFVRYPVYVGDDKEQANRQESLWRKSPSDVTAEEYKQFYQQMTMDFEEPVATVHFASDMPVNVRALLFVPKKREGGILAARKEPGVMLYSHNVLIQEYCTDLLPNWLSFVDGVVDSEDISLNVSRETVQSNRIMAQLAKTVKGRVLRELKKLATDEPEKYVSFWGEFGRFFKEAVATDFSAKEDVLPLFRYVSSKSDGKLTSLDEYIERMPESQTEIYYVLGDSIKSVANSPHLDPFKARDLEVLYWVDPIDPFVSPMLAEYKEKKLRNVDDASIELPELAEEAAEDKPESKLEEADFNRVIGRFVTTLGSRVTEVRASKVLKNSPIRLVSPEDETNRDMQRIQRILDQNYEVPKKIVEVNRNHPLIANLAHLVSDSPDNELINLTIEQLYDSALVQEGLHPNPTEMVPRIQQLLELATAS